jgi:transposase
LQTEGLKRGEEGRFAEEMRLGLLGQVRRMWGKRGEKAETKYRTEVRVGVFGVRGGCDAGAAVVGLGEAGVEHGDSSGAQGVVWDHAAFHEGKAMGEVGLQRAHQPPYAPELNPAERVWEEVRWWVEGRRYERIEAKKAAVEEVLRWLEAERKVSSLVGWRYIRQALNALPS